MAAMFKGLVLFVGAVVGGIIYLLKVRESRARMALLDRGEMCIACDGTDVENDGTSIRCRTCGQVCSLAAIKGAKVSDDEITMLAAPDERKSSKLFPPYGPG